MIGYADTSFIAPLYVPDVHSPAAAAVMARANGPVLITALCDVEMSNAIELRYHRKEITRQQAKAAAQAFDEDVRSGVFSLQPMPAAMFDKAKGMARQYTHVLGTRSLDLLHVAAALSLGADTFFSFDRNQRKLARGAGLALRPKELPSRTLRSAR